MVISVTVLPTDLTNVPGSLGIPVVREEMLHCK